MNHEVEEFGGIPANPEYEVLMEALQVIKEKNITYLLAVGGGSVIDGTKYLAAAAKYNGEPWDILRKSVRTMEGQALPFATVLTLPATGSEMNSGYVISRRATRKNYHLADRDYSHKFLFLILRLFVLFRKIRLPMVLPMHTLM